MHVIQPILNFESIDHTKYTHIHTQKPTSTMLSHTDQIYIYSSDKRGTRPYYSSEIQRTRNNSSIYIEKIIFSTFCLTKEFST